MKPNHKCTRSNAYRIGVKLDDKWYAVDFKQYKDGFYANVRKSYNNNLIWDRNGNEVWISPSQNVAKFYVENSGRCRSKKDAKEQTVTGENLDLDDWRLWAKEIEKKEANQ